MEKISILYKDETKIIYETNSIEYFVVKFIDTNKINQNNEIINIPCKGKINCGLASTIFEIIESGGIPTRYVERYKSDEIIVRKTEPINLYVNVSNEIFGREYISYFSKEENGIYNITREGIKEDNSFTKSELDIIKKYTSRINDLLNRFFIIRGIILSQYTIEFGRTNVGQIILSSEISLDSCSFWDENNKVMIGTLENKSDINRLRREIIKFSSELFLT